MDVAKALNNKTIFSNALKEPRTYHFQYFNVDPQALGVYSYTNA